MKLMQILRAGKAPARPPLRFIALTMLGAALAIGVLGWLTRVSSVPWLMAPFGASCVLVFGVPESPLAQPRNVVAGHFVTSLVGLLVLEFLGAGWATAALAVALGIGAMQFTSTTHPPAGANPLVVMAAQPAWGFLLTPVLVGAVAIVLVGLLSNNLRQKASYPRYWY